MWPNIRRTEKYSSTTKCINQKDLHVFAHCGTLSDDILLQQKLYLFQPGDSYFIEILWTAGWRVGQCIQAADITVLIQIYIFFYLSPDSFLSLSSHFFLPIFSFSDLSKYLWFVFMRTSNPVTVNRPLSQHLSPTVLSSFHPPSSYFPLFIVSPLPLRANTKCHLRTFYCLKHINLSSGWVISLSSRVTALLF